ncbi:MAG: riboflavin synthase [Candidatus Omnitrophica bacterium]|nr:riboflavin synthase [Candidatus Omnitrophota bacterium]
MFTGIIEDLGVIKENKNSRLLIKSAIFNGEKTGQSIAVNGVCLTILGVKNAIAAFDIMAETIKRSTLWELKAGDRVNLERALKMTDRLSGHFVSGHIDRAGKIISRDTGSASRIKIKIPKEDLKFVIEKGSIAVDGISLTVSDLGPDNFSVYLIPHTIESTTFKFRKVNDKVNIEFDQLGKYALNAAQKEPAVSITEDFLRRHGYR